MGADAGKTASLHTRIFDYIGVPLVPALRPDTDPWILDNNNPWRQKCGLTGLNARLVKLYNNYRPIHFIQTSICRPLGNIYPYQ